MTVSSLVAGVYVFRLTVTDNKGATATNDATVTVKAAANKPPVANAGPNQTITLPTNSVTVNGSGNDSDGTISSYLWDVLSGPGGKISYSSKNSASTTISGLIAGTYVFALTVTDNLGLKNMSYVTIIVNAHAQNKIPVANAGGNESITLPVNSVILNGSGNDSDGTVASYSWSKMSGPSGNFTYTALNNPKLTVSGLLAGTYVFRLTVTDNSGASSYNDATVTVTAAAVNKIPVANAGGNQAITLPANSVTLNGSGNDSDGTIASYKWSTVSGPSGNFTYSNLTNSKLTVSGLLAGTYVFRLTVTDNNGASSYNDATVTVNAATLVNKAPVVNAGADQTITLPTNTIVLNGSATDSDGTIAAYQWSFVSGPSGQLSYTSPLNPKVTVSKLLAGTYVFRLTATDNKGAKASDDISVTVNNGVLNVPGPAKYINVQVYGGSNAYNNSQWNNWNVGIANASNISSSSFAYSDGTASSISANLSTSVEVSDNGAPYGKKEQNTMVPAEVLRYTSYSTSSRTLTISGLTASRKYDLVLYASRSTNSGNSTVFTCGSLNASIETLYNMTVKASFTGLTPNSAGQIVVNLSNTAKYNYINGFTLTDGSAATSAQVSAVQTNAVASVQANALTSAARVGIAPNPVQDRFLLQVNNSLSGAMSVQLVDMSGAVRKHFSVSKSSGNSQTYLSIGDLPAGEYLISIQMSGWSDTEKLIKQ